MASVVAFFDPAQPGCWKRFKRALLALLGLTACGLVTAAVITARRPMGRFMVGATLESVRAYPAALWVATSLVEDYPDVNAAFYLLQASGQRHVGDVEAHNRTLEEAVARFPRTYSANDDRCLYGALFDDPITALPYCDVAVALAPPDKEILAQAHRGLARALAGDTPGAIVDLDEAVGRWQDVGRTEDRFARPYGEFLEGLKAGRDVFDAETLERERARY